MSSSLSFSSCYSEIQFFLPIPEILISSRSFRPPLNEMQFGSPEEFYQWLQKISHSKNRSKTEFSAFVKHVGNLKFNPQHTPLKYRQRFKKYCYLHKDSIHPFYPITTETQHNQMIETIKTEFSIENPCIKIEIFPVGFVSLSLSFITSDIPTGDILEKIKQKFLKFIKGIKVSIIQALYLPEKAQNVFTQVTPDFGLIIHILKPSQSSQRQLKLSSSWKELGKFNLGKFQIHHLHENRFIAYPWKLSRTIRKDLLFPIRWATALNSIFDIFTFNIINWLSDPNVNQYDNLWLAVVYTLNPHIHLPSYEGKSPYFIRSYQKKIFKRMIQLYDLDKKHNNFLNSLKHQGPNLAPLAHHSIIDLYHRKIIDQRLGLITGIRSNLKRTSSRDILSLSETEEQIINVLLKKYGQDYNQYLHHGMKIGTEDMGCMVLKKLGERLGWSDHKIYSTEKFNLKNLILILYEKGLIKTKTVAKGRILNCCIDPHNDYIRTRIGKTIHRIRS